MRARVICSPNEIVVTITTVHEKEKAMKTSQKVTIGGILTVVALDIVIDEAESLILKAFKALIEWFKSLCLPPQQPGWYC